MDVSEANRLSNPFRNLKDERQRCTCHWSRSSSSAIVAQKSWADAERRTKSQLIGDLGRHRKRFEEHSAKHMPLRLEPRRSNAE